MRWIYNERVFIFLRDRIDFACSTRITNPQFLSAYPSHQLKISLIYSILFIIKSTHISTNSLPEIAYSSMQRNFNYSKNILSMERKIKANQRRKYSELKQYQDSHQAELFAQAQTYPPFFHENLVDDERKIKIFKNNPHTHQIVFYFQLLKLIFETEDSQYEKYLQKIYDIIDNPDFQIHFPKSNHPYYLPLTTSKIKRILVEFLDRMGEGQLAVEQALQKYPVMNTVFVLFLRTLLIIAEQCRQFDEQADPMEIYQLLANYFQIQITYYGNCLRFNQVDVFAYLQSREEVYLAYISPTEQEVLSSSELYHTDPEEAFNISSVKQMVSEIEIDLPTETDCFVSSKSRLDNTQEVDYNYSHSSDTRVVSRTFNEGSDLKFSYLINEDSFQNVKSNKILEKELIGEKKSFGNYKLPTQIECYKIEEVPSQLENAITPSLTPRQSKFVSFGKEEAQKYDKQNIYGRKKKSSNLKDTIKEQYELLSNYQSAFKHNQVYLDTAQSWNKKSEENIECEQVKQLTTLKSLYGIKSIKSICSQEHQSFLVSQTPFMSKMPSRKQTTTKQEQCYKPTSKNTSSEFTSSFILRQMQEPYQSSIRSIKIRSRTNRPNLQKMMLL